jgi:hypothetical protein
LLTALLGEDEAFESLKRVLIERTEGNPFFLEETVRTLVKTKVLVGNRGAYRMTKAPETWQIPATVQASLAARIDRLPPQDKRLLQAASVIGKDVPFRLLQAIADVGVSGAAAVALKCWTCRGVIRLAPLRMICASSWQGVGAARGDDAPLPTPDARNPYAGGLTHPAGRGQTQTGPATEKDPPTGRAL